MTMVGSSHCQVLVPGHHHHQDDACGMSTLTIVRMLLMKMMMTILKITHPSLFVSPAEERAKPNLDSVKPSVRRTGGVEESNLIIMTMVMKSNGDADNDAFCEY